MGPQTKAEDKEVIYPAGLLTWDLEVSHSPASDMTMFIQYQIYSGPMEKEMATDSSIVAWRIPRTEEPGGLKWLSTYSGQSECKIYQAQ